MHYCQIMLLLCYQAVTPRLLAASSGIQQVQLPCLTGSLDQATLALAGSNAICPISTPCQEQGMLFAVSVSLTAHLVGAHNNLPVGYCDVFRTWACMYHCMLNVINGPNTMQEKPCLMLHACLLATACCPACMLPGIDVAVSCKQGMQPTCLHDCSK